MSEELTPDAIQRRMREVRRDIDEDVDEIIENARTMTDWRAYLQQYPWACLGAAAAVGYLVVPKRVEIKSPDAAAIAKLAKKNQLVVKANPEPHERQGLAGFAFGMLANAAIRGATGLVGQQLGRLFDPSSHPNTGNSSNGTEPNHSTARS